jgi:hypothetical protein
LKAPVLEGARERPPTPILEGARERPPTPILEGARERPPTKRGWAARHRDLLIVTLAALAVRLVWNLSVHRPMDFVFSDMGGYLERARTSIDFPDQPRGYFALFPWGTHWLLSLLQRAFGRDDKAGMGAAYAVIGAIGVGYAFALCRRLTRSRWTSRAVGAALVVYYPWIALGGYLLSEPPFTLFLCATAFHGLAYADRGRARSAVLFGVTMAAAAIFRPQILASLPLYGVAVLWRRRSFRRVRPAVILPAVILPLALVTAVSAVRVRFHTGRYGFIAGNGPLNLAFGRCHATSIHAVAPDRRSDYSPPSLGGLAAWGAHHPGSFFQLDPAMGTSLTVNGHVWEAEPFEALARECVRATGLARQVRYSLAHVALLWFFDPLWPDGGQPRFGPYMAASQVAHDVLVLPAALWAMARALRRRRARALLLSLHVLSLVAVAVVYFGDTRLRAPYDGILITLAAISYAGMIGAVRRRRAAAARGAAPAVPTVPAAAETATRTP